jgi:hypothetical protein
VCGIVDSSKVIALPDSLPARDAAARTVLDRRLTVILSCCLMQQRFGLADAL